MFELILRTFKEETTFKLSWKSSFRRRTFYIYFSETTTNNSFMVKVFSCEAPITDCNIERKCQTSLCGACILEVIQSDEEQGLA